MKNSNVPDLFLMMILALSPLSCGQASGQSRDTAPLPSFAPGKRAAEDEASLDLPPLPAWELTGNLRAAVGKNDNVALSAVQPEPSAFVRGEAELFWWRFPTERFEALVFANGARTQFLESDEHQNEWEAFAHGEARWFATKTLQVVFSSEVYAMNRALDFSVSVAEPMSARVKVNGAMGSTALRWNFISRIWVEVEPVWQREKYGDGSDDNRQNAARFTLGGSNPEQRIEANCSLTLTRIDFDRRNQFALDGTELTGAKLIFHQREGRGRFAVLWDRAKQWRTVTEAGVMFNDDDGSGYFDYRLQLARQEIIWTRPPWRVRALGRVSRYDYDAQTVESGTVRYRQETFLQTRVERELGRHVTFFAEYSSERVRSNDPLTAYRANIVMAGVDWRW